MAKVTLTMSMSLDGFVAGPKVSVEHPMGEGGERLHDWLFNRSPKRGASTPHTPMTDVDASAVDEVFATTGAVILGKRTFDVGLSQWGDTPYPAPSFVLTHRPRQPLAQKSGTFTFVSDGIEKARCARPKRRRGERNVILMGADIAQQYIKAGLVDEIEINLVPVLLTHGVRLFEHIGTDQIELEQTRLLESAEVTHIRFRVLK